MGRYHYHRPPTGAYEFLKMTAEGEAYTLRYGVPPPDDSHIPDNVVRADSVNHGDGLICKTTYDASNRPIHEFKSIDGKKHWMREYSAPARLQVVLSKDPEWNRAKLQRFLAENPEAQT